jgi:hypothetical protein
MVFSFNAIIAQVGIGTINPTESLDVMGAVAIDHQKTFSNRGQWISTQNIISGIWMDITPSPTLPTGTYLCETTFQVSSLPAHLWYVRLSYMLSYTAVSNSWNNNSYYNIPISISSHHTDNVTFNMRIKIGTGQTQSRIQLRCNGNGIANNVLITTKYVKLF